jgi:hypothetical protein
VERESSSIVCSSFVFSRFFFFIFTWRRSNTGNARVSTDYITRWKRKNIYDETMMRIPKFIHMFGSSSLFYYSRILGGFSKLTNRTLRNRKRNLVAIFFYTEKFQRNSGPNLVHWNRQNWKIINNYEVNDLTRPISLIENEIIRKII